jgi:hypothetical protein
MMQKQKKIQANSPTLKMLHFRPYRYQGAERQAEQFVPDDDAAVKQVQTPWGGTLTAEPGDYIVRDANNPHDAWVVKKDIFDSTYVRTKRGTYVKAANVFLAPLTEITGDDDEEVVIDTKEGSVTVRAGDFYLAKGVEDEIWPVPKEKVGTDLLPVDEKEDTQEM